MVPKRPQDGSKVAQDGPRGCQHDSKIAPRRLREGLKEAQDNAKAPQDSQDSQDGVLDAPKTDQDRPGAAQKQTKALQEQLLDHQRYIDCCFSEFPFRFFPEQVQSFRAFRRPQNLWCWPPG